MVVANNHHDIPKSHVVQCHRIGRTRTCIGKCLCFSAKFISYRKHNSALQVYLVYISKSKILLERVVLTLYDGDPGKCDRAHNIISSSGEYYCGPVQISHVKPTIYKDLEVVFMIATTNGSSAPPSSICF